MRWPVTSLDLAPTRWPLENLLSSVSIYAEDKILSFGLLPTLESSDMPLRQKEIFVLVLNIITYPSIYNKTYFKDKIIRKFYIQTIEIYTGAHFKNVWSSHPKRALGLMI